ncbi:hypothetical protein Tco_0388120, partial [Tanacetum coccineum]
MMLMVLTVFQIKLFGVLISEETIRADLLFDDVDGVDCFPKQVIWDSLRDIGYEDVDVAVTPDLERKSDETEQVIIEEEKDTSDVKSGDTEELDLERIQSTARQ